MSDHLDSIPAPKSLGELTENIVDGLREKRENLRTSIFNASRMASILATLIESVLDSDMTEVIGKLGANNYYCTKDTREDIMFSVYKVQDEIKALEAAFQEAAQ